MSKKKLPLDCISPIDGRYCLKTGALAKHFSERALIKNRIKMEAMYLVLFCREVGIGFSSIDENLLYQLINEAKDIEEIAKRIETLGFQDIPPTNHDVKSIEYCLAYLIKDTSLKKYINYIHFALTSEDTTSTAISLMVMGGLNEVLIPNQEKITKSLNDFAVKYAKAPMLSRTHGQAATPTTLGKEFSVFAHRLNRQLLKLKNFSMPTKLNGASGNLNAHVSAYPKIDWIKFSDKYIQSVATKYNVSLETNLCTTQIESHDGLYELFSILKHINLVLIDISNDIWSYISEDWIMQKPITGEIGSSTMPHKVNPIDFENSEGNAKMANGLFNALDALLISRRQRDLSDSTMLRNIGTAFAHCLISYQSILKGLGKIEANLHSLDKALENNPAVITEPIQTILRREGVDNPYELLKNLSRGRILTLDIIHEFIDTLPVSKEIQNEMKEITPQNYIGLAPVLSVL